MCFACWHEACHHCCVSYAECLCLWVYQWLKKIIIISNESMYRVPNISIQHMKCNNSVTSYLFSYWFNYLNHFNAVICLLLKQTCWAALSMQIFLGYILLSFNTIHSYNITQKMAKKGTILPYIFKVFKNLGIIRTFPFLKCFHQR